MRSSPLRAPRVATSAVCASLFLAACTSDLPAPDCYNDACQITGLESATAGGDIAVVCDDIPDGALEATYDYTPTITGGDDMYTVMAVGLPEGLSIDGVTGRIMGTPTQVGMVSAEVQVTDGSGATGSAMCEFEVNPGLGVDVELLLETAPFCVRQGETINDFVVEGTGDGTAITCGSPGGNGNGDAPAGVSVDPDTCEIEGTLMEDRLGTYVWIVQGTQSGNDVYIPYCVTQDMEAGYTVSADHSGLAMNNVDGTLVPIVRRFNPDAPFDVGGGGDPLFTITDPTACTGNACFYGFAFGINASPFEIDSDNLLSPNMLLNNNAGEPIGFTHELQLTGPNVDAAPTFAEDFGDRPWLVNIAIDYCINAVESECEGSENIRANGDGGIEMAVVMFPE